MGRLAWLLRAFALLFAMAVAAPVLLAPPASAQSQDQQTAPDYSAWETFASRAEAVVANPHATGLALDLLRRQVVAWRSQFQAAQSANKTRIATLQQQIQALGPLPEAGATEAPEIAQRRKELNDQLAKLQAPGLAADEAYSRADGIVREIDNLVRARQTAALMHLGPSPVNPANWPAGLGLISSTAATVWREIADAWSIEYRRTELGSNLPLILGYLIFAGILLGRGRRWVERLTQRFMDRLSAHGQAVLGLLTSLLQASLPMLGVVALIQAIGATGLIGLTGQSILAVLRVMGVEVFAALWLGGQIFPRPASGPALLDLPPERQAEGRLHAGILGLLFALDLLRRAAFRAGPANEAADAVLSFPILALAGLSLFRIGLLLRRHLGTSAPEDERASYSHRLLGTLGRGLMIVALAAPLFGAVGYIAAASAVIFPSALSLALIAILVLVQRLIDTIYHWATKLPDGEESGLVPVLFGFALSLLSLPIFALIWGARSSDLAELWSRFAQGFSIGTTHISPANFLTFVVLFAVGYGITRLLQGALKTAILPKTRIDTGGQNAIAVGVGYLGLVVSALVAITGAGIDLSGLAIVAGALSVGIGFGLQNIVSNFVSGIILLIERPVAEGDWIEAGGVQGTVRSISVRSTRIETFDRADVIVPNSNLITGTVTNMTKYSRVGRLIVPVGVAYGTDTRRVDRILHEIAEAQPLVVLNPKPQVVFQGFGADSLNFEIRVILRDVNFVLDVRNEMNHQIAERFAEEGIEIPFAQRDIWLRNPEALRGALPAAAPAAPAAPPPPSAAAPRIEPDIAPDTDAER